MPNAPTEFPPRTLDQEAAEDALFPALMAGLFGGAAGVTAAAGLFGAFVCVGLAKFLYGEYLRFKRRGYYACERKREEAHRAFEAAVAELKRTGDPGLRKYQAAVQTYVAELSRIEDDYRRETGRSYWDGPDPPRRRNDEDNRGGRNPYLRESRWNDSPRSRDRRWGGTPWASPKAVAFRRRRRERRMAAWREWARTFAEAVRLGKPLPLSPAERRTGGGAPVRRLCERSSCPPPTPEALLTQYDKAKGRGPVEEKIRLGSMMLDIEAAVDSSLVRDSERRDRRTQRRRARMARRALPGAFPPLRVADGLPPARGRVPQGPRPPRPAPRHAVSRKGVSRRCVSAAGPRSDERASRRRAAAARVARDAHGEGIRRGAVANPALGRRSAKTNGIARPKTAGRAPQIQPNSTGSATGAMAPQPQKSSPAQVFWFSHCSGDEFSQIVPVFS